MSRDGVASLAGQRVAIYARYSSANQREASIDDQVRRCSEFIAQRGGTIASELVFLDRATSGASLHRAGFERMFALAKAKRIDAIVTEDSSRISRELADATKVFRDLAYLEIPLLGVADGMDTSAKNAKLAYQVKAIVNDVYLDDLRDKTKRGLEGRALAGYSTGGLPYGYRSRPVEQAGRVVGYEILINEEQAAVLRQIFQDAADGQSYDSIAKRLTAAQVPPPRAQSRGRLKGWVSGTIRAFLRNDAYIGHWSYREKEWRKLPGTNIKRYRARPAEEVIRGVYPERAIIGRSLWDTVQARLSSRARKYKGKPASGEASSLSPRTNYALSGLLTCGDCGAPMVISGGSSASYYKCNGFKKRGTCQNGRSVREDVVRAKILGAVGALLTSPRNILELRRLVKDRLRTLSQGQDQDLRQAQTRLASTEAKISRLIEAVSEGISSPYLAQSLKDLEAQATADKTTIERMTALPSQGLVLPHPALLVQQALNLQEMFARDPVAGREALRRLLGGQSVVLRPDPSGHYVAEATLFPLLTLDRESSREVRGPAVGCAGPQLDFPAQQFQGVAEVWVPFEEAIVIGWR